MIDKLLTKLDALHAAATAGEWEAEYPIGEETAWLVEAGKLSYEWRCLAMVTEYDEEVSPNEGKANLDFILAAHNHYPALRDEIRRLREELATAERRGAAKELRRLADEWERFYAPGLADALRDRAAELEGKC